MMQFNLVAVVDNRLPTAGTDGDAAFLNADFMASRNGDDRRFILAHEVWHCALGHHRRQLRREPERWNHACYYEVNAQLKGMLGHCPREALYKAGFVGQPAEQIYPRLAARTPPRRRTRSGSPRQLLDVHDLTSVLSDGGSDIRPVFDALKATPPSVLVAFTNGYIAAPENSLGYPMLLCLSERGR